MRHGIAAWSVLMLALVPPLAAQPVRLRLDVGASSPASDQFRRLLITPSATGFGRVQYVGRQSPGFMVAVHAATVGRRLGLEASASYRNADREIASQASGGGVAANPPKGATILVGAVRLVCRPGPDRFHVAAGPAFLHFGGPAYDSTASSGLGLAKRGVWGANVAIRAQVLTRGRFRVSVALEDVIYRVRLTAVPAGDTTQTPLQHDLAITVGTSVNLR